MSNLRTLFEQLWRDVRVAVRRLAKAPFFSGFAVVTLALGIGITTAVYSFIYGFVSADVGARDKDRVLQITQMAGYYRGFSYPEFLEVRDAATTLEHASAVSTFSSALTGVEDPELIEGEAVSGTLFPMLGLTPALGRLIQPADDEPGAAAVIVLADTTWRRQFHADPSIVGRSVRMAGRVFEVVGVTPPAFRSVSGAGQLPQRQMDVWVAIAAAPGQGPGFTFDRANRKNRTLQVFARLRPSATIDSVKAELQPVILRLESLDPLDQSGRRQPRALVVARAFEFKQQRGSEAAFVILSIPALVLLVACTNLGNLVVSRGTSRLHESAVRRALGASRGRLIREQLVEGAIIAAVGGCLGIVLASQLLDYAYSTLRETFGSMFRPMSQIAPGIQPGVLLAAAGFALLALLVSSLWPALQLTKVSDRTVLASDTGTGATPRWRQRSNLIALQVTVSVCLFLITSLGVTVLATDAREQIRTGLDKAAVVQLPFMFQQRDEARVRETVDRVMTSMRQAPDVTHVAAATMSRYATWSTGFITRSDQPFQPKDLGTSIEFRAATPDYQTVVAIDVLAGRWFDVRDAAGGERVVVINRSLSTAVFGNADPVGRDVRLKSNGPGIDEAAFRIVGVIADDLDERGRSQDIAYFPFAQQYGANVEILVKGTSPDVRPLVTQLRTAVRRADPDVAIAFAGRADFATRKTGLVMMRMVTTVAGSLATVTLLLSMTGLYGVLSHVVSRRTREFGLRIALGAGKSAITRLVVRQGIRPALEGLFIGMGAAAVIRMMLQPSFTKSFAIFDVTASILAAVPLLAAAMLACYLPARRASRVDPNVALRQL